MLTKEKESEQISNLPQIAWEMQYVAFEGASESVDDTF